MKTDFVSARKNLVKQMQLFGVLKTKSIINAFLKVERERFFSESQQHMAYVDAAFPIGFGQTISQPTTIAIMLEFLQTKKGQNVLEIGSGCGYVLSLLSEIVGEKGKVFGIEIIPELKSIAEANISKLGYKNILVFNGDGTLGLKKFAPFDRILFSAACPEIPSPVIEQLANNGRIVAPVGKFMQMLHVLEKDAKGNVSEREVPEGPFVFVSLKGKYGFK